MLNIRKFTVLLLTLTFTLSATANVKVLFHPHDPSLKEISEYILGAKETVDLALYNVDASDRNPVIKTIKSDEVQKRLQNGDLKIRLIFEGYEAKEANQSKMLKLEEMGIDTKFMGMSRKMHHKFAVIDAQTNSPVLITGSANWSMASRRNYNENILYIENKPGITSTFQSHFNLLWSKAKEYGFQKEYETLSSNSILEDGFRVHFNTENLKLTKTGFRKDSKAKGFALTREIVKLIDQAETKIEIATTRIKLRPIYEAIKKAAKRGVKVDILVTMGEYEYQYKRRRAKIKDCTNIYNEKCSTSQNFSIFLDKHSYEGKENVSVRLKYFDIRTASYLQKQMHSKYIIADDTKLITGSFNWSVSAEYNHFENIIYIDGKIRPRIVESFKSDFSNMWPMNRENYDSLVEQFEVKAKNKEQVKCGFEPTALTFSEIDYLLNSGKRMGTSLSKLCK